MPRRRSSSFREKTPRHGTNTSSTGSQQSDDDAWSFSTSGISSRSSADSALIEHFSESDSDSNSSIQTVQSSESEPELSSNQHPGFLTSIVRNTLQSAAKIRARKLFSQLIAVEDGKDSLSIARRRQYEAATGLVKIIENRPEGKEVVGRRFVKRKSRQDRGTRALLKLSEDQLHELGHKAVSPVSEPLAFTELLGVVARYGNGGLLFQKTIPTALRTGEEGVAGILYLAVTHTRRFFQNIDHWLVLDFCKWIITTEEPLSPKYHCGAKLFCVFLMNECHSEGSYGPLVLGLLSSICAVLIQQATVALNPDVSRKSDRASAARGPPLLPLIAMCCDKIRRGGHWSALPPSNILSPFIERLIDLLHPETGQRRLSAERGFALWALMSLLDRPSIASLIPCTDLPKLGTVFVDITLHPWIGGFQEADAFEKKLLTHFNVGLGQRCISTLCKLPEPTFTDALSSALSNGLRRLKSPGATPYEPLSLVERLLWLSNMRPLGDDSERIHRTLVQGGTCGLLAYVVCETGDLDPKDRGIWRAKGLAMTCLGNIIEKMDEEQCRKIVKKQVIDAVVTLKGSRDVPELQRGQAILLLKRYTWVADRWSIQPYYREDTSDLPEEFRRVSI